MSQDHVSYESSAGQANDPTRKRYGIRAAKIGSTIEYRPVKRTTRGVVEASSLHMDVQQRNLFDDLAHSWHCRSIISIQSKKGWEPCQHMAEHPSGFATKQELIKAHGKESDLRANEEMHIYFAVAEEPAVIAQSAVVKDGKEIKPAVVAQPAKVTLLSDDAFDAS